MKRAGLWALGIGALVSVGPLALERAYAADNDGKCTLATLKGRYLFATTGTALPPAFGLQEGDPPLLISVAGYQIFLPIRLAQGGWQVLDMFVWSEYPAPVLGWR